MSTKTSIHYTQLFVAHRTHIHRIGPPLLAHCSIKIVRAWQTMGLSSTLSLRALPRMRATIGNAVMRSVGSKQNLGNNDQICVHGGQGKNTSIITQNDVFLQIRNQLKKDFSNYSQLQQGKVGMPWLLSVLYMYIHLYTLIIKNSKSHFMMPQCSNVVFRLHVTGQMLDNFYTYLSSEQC